MINIILTKGIPASGKSSWAIAKVAEDPLSYIRINNDQIRNMCNSSVLDKDYEKLIHSIRVSLIKNGIKHNKNIIIDNVNASSSHWKEVCKIVQEANVDAIVSEKSFYIDLNKAILRDSKREGIAKVGEQVIRKFWKQLNGAKFKDYQERTQTFTKNININEAFVPLVQDETLEPTIISDLDGTCALFVGKRSAYDATDCDLIDEPNRPVIETIKHYYNAGHKIIFVSGRQDKYEPETRRFLEKHFPNFQYELFLRKTGDLRKDSIIKEEIFNNNIKDKYFVKLILDDRDSVVKLWRSLGLTCFQVAYGNF
jgi:predicted kinase